MIATQLADAGYFTTAVTGNGFVNADGGYDARVPASSAT